MTLHKGKGLEFPQVFLPAWEAGAFPTDYGDPAEERRLAYVALTRGMRRVTITHCDSAAATPMRPALSATFRMQPRGRLVAETGAASNTGPSASNPRRCVERSGVAEAVLTREKVKWSDVLRPGAAELGRP